jgi:hypothetical protein
MLSAAEACVAVGQNIGKIGEGAYHALSAGLIVTYAKPFMEANGLGPLPAKYQQFPGEQKLAWTHEDVMRGRNSIYAHFSPGEASQMVPGSEEVSNPRVTFESGKLIKMEMLVTGWKPENLNNFYDLCFYQCGRLLADSDALVRHLKGADDYPDGVYQLGISFPKP